MPKAAVLTIGTELLLGKVVDTNGAYLGEVLSSAGFDVAIRVSVGDHLGEITSWIRNLLDDMNLVVTTGGLGPTKDDLTRQAVADAVGVPLVFKEALLREIEEIFTSRGFHMTENNRRQAYLPDGALPISNPMGTAPAFLFRIAKGHEIVCLPGVPRELKFLMEKRVLPILRRDFGLEGYVKRTRVLKVCGLGESGVDQQIGDLMKTEGNPFVGVLASPGMIRILITAEGEDESKVARMIGEVEREIRHRLGKLIFGADDDTLEGVVTEALAERGARLRLEDEATGGALARMILKARGGGYSLQGWCDYAENPEAEIYLQVRARPEGSDDGLKLFEIFLCEDTREKRVSLHLGGPRENVENRLAIIALDQLRKWMKLG